MTPDFKNKEFLAFWNLKTCSWSVWSQGVTRPSNLITAAFNFVTWYQGR